MADFGIALILGVFWTASVYALDIIVFSATPASPYTVIFIWSTAAYFLGRLDGKRAVS